MNKKLSTRTTKNIPLLYVFGHNDNTNRYNAKKGFTPIATDNLRDKNIYFETDTEPVPCRKKYREKSLAIFKSQKQPSGT